MKTTPTAMKHVAYDDLAEVPTTQAALSPAVSESFEVQPAPKLEKSQTRFIFLLFLFIGAVQLLGWNAVLNSMSNIGSLVYPNESPLIDTVTVTYSTVIMVATMIFIKWSVVHVYTTYAGLALSAICAILAGVAAHLPFSGASALFHTVGGLMALSAALIGSSAFGYATRFPGNQCGVLSSGMGLAGVITFTGWMIAQYAIFKQDATGTQSANWLLQVIVFIFSVGTIGLGLVFFNRSWVQEIMTAERQTAENDTEKTAGIQEKKGTYEEGGLKLVIQKVWWLAALYVLHMYITLYCFPTVGPAHWKDLPYEGDIIVGTFQLADLAGRYIPNVVPKLLVGKKTLVVAIIARLVFVVTFMLTFSLRTSTAFFGYFFVHFIQMFLLALTNGWLCTCCFVRMPQMVEGDAAKDRVASISLLSTFFGIAGGQWTAYGVMKALD